MNDLPLLIETLPLGPRAEVRISLDSFNGRPRLDVRTWCILDDPGELRPTKRGVSLALAAVPTVRAALDRAITTAVELGLEQGSTKAA